MGLAIGVVQPCAMRRRGIGSCPSIVYSSAMFEWPKFAAHLCGGRSPELRIASLLGDLAESLATPSATDVLLALFDDHTLVHTVKRLAPLVDHIGFVAPSYIGVAAIEEVLKESPFRERPRTFKSAVLVKDLACRLGRDVDVTVVQGNLGGRGTRAPGVEVFVADVAAHEVERLVAQEAGCHVALALDSSHALDCVRTVLHAHGRWEIPLMRNGPIVNREIHSSVLYVDVPGPERTRRLEFIVFSDEDATAVSSTLVARSI